jgi:hypothetical protein
MADATQPVTQAHPASARGTWYLYAVVLGSVSVICGLIWDISWHRTIGRDTFWTPAHLAIYLGGILAGCSSGWLVLQTTFRGTAEQRAVTVSFWGFRGPLGAWVCIWGALAMVTSAPFDDWWHNAYGLDVTILSPPHAVLGMGVAGIQVGALLLTVAAQNRRAGGGGGGEVPRGDSPTVVRDPQPLRRLTRLYVLAAGILVTMHAVMTMEYNFTNQMHSARFYQVSAIVFPVVLVAAARAARLRFPATAIAAVYMGLMLVMIWFLPLFPGEPKLAPITNPVTRLVPPHFPILLVIPAVGIDLLMARLAGKDWRLSVLLGVSFVGLLLAAQWYFAEFLLSPAARNPFFAAGRWGYNEGPGDWWYRFWALDGSAGGTLDPRLLARGLGIAVLLGVVSSRIGLWWGKWMARVQR